MAQSGLELLQAQFDGHAYDKHRHDTYSFGLTESGVQSFTYRGVLRNSLAGDVIVLHPDEAHDGHAGGDQGFRYRMLYVDPARIAKALRALKGTSAPLPFLACAVTRSERLSRHIRTAFMVEGDPLAMDGIILGLAEGLIAAVDGPEAIPAMPKCDGPALQRAREFLEAECGRVVRTRELERITGLSRFVLARQFKASFGTSPYRYALNRRLDRARKAISTGQSLASLAQDSGFADQAHFTRKFKAAYGITPARYRALTRA